MRRLLDVGRDGVLSDVTGPVVGTDEDGSEGDQEGEEYEGPAPAATPDYLAHSRERSRAMRSAVGG